MQPQILITRAREDSEETAVALAKLGYATIIDPVLSIKALPWREPEWKDVAGIFVTSKNALVGFDGHYVPKEKMFFLVGERTQTGLRAKGYVHVTGTVERSDDLPALVCLQHRASEGRFVHLTAPHSHDAFYNVLTAEGFVIDRIQVYDAVAAHDLQSSTVAAIKAGQVAGVTFYSARSAEIFHDLIEKNRLSASLKTMQAICLSASVAESCRGEWGAVHVAERPTQKHLLDCLANAIPGAHAS